MFNKRSKFIWPGGKEMDLRKESLHFRNQLKKLKQEELSNAYWALVEFLNYEHRLETSQTIFENILYGVMESITLMNIHRSIWIGKRNFDFFIPSICGNKRINGKNKFFNGMVIEVDGGIHNEEFKMKQDESKYEQVHRLDIATFVILNNSISDPQVNSFLKSLPYSNKSDSRTKKRLWRNIYLVTLLSHKHLILEENITPSRRIIEVLEG